MKSQFTRKAKPEPATTPTALEPKTKTKLASPRPRSTTVVVKRRNCCRGNDVLAIGGGNSGGGTSRGGNSGGGTSRGGNHRGGNSRGSNSGGGNTGGKNPSAVNSRGGRGFGSAGGNRGKEPSCQFVPVRRKPLGDYMVLEEEPLTSSLPTTSSSFLSDNPTPMSYAAAVESHPVSRLKVKVVLSPRLKRAGNQPLVKPRQSPKNSPFAKVKVNPPSQSKPHNVQVNTSKRNLAQVAPQSRLAQGNNPKPSNSQTPSAGSSKSKSKRSKKAKQKQLAEAKSEVLLVVPPQPTSLQSSPPKFSEAFAYLDHHHEQMQRILAEQTAGQGPYPNRGHVKSCKHTVQLPAHRSLFDFDERLFRRGDLEAAALLAQNKVMLRKWLDPSMLIS
ncbi:uncharacterized protein [Drosophila takahashii]|uniref:uncharacterized protein isoform X2 n=1 Tax=Drosophila takahashii TaxID=29030 RepID=UPI001CF8B869|nr:translation initiation factor IF-2 isoform X2 [Drosophila takahashii]